MGLTPEQQERIRLNRERAYKIQQEKKRKQEEEQQKQQQQQTQEGEESYIDKRVTAAATSTMDGKECRSVHNITSPPLAGGEANKRQKVLNGNGKEEDDDDDDSILEEFEINASDYVTKNDAKNIYCLPDGTLAICDYIEKDNPHNNKFKPMKLYVRKEIRKRARKRYGGLIGLQEERRKRQLRKYENDIQKTKNIFK